MDRDRLIKIGNDAIHKAHTSGLSPTENYRHLTLWEQAEAVINGLLDKGFSIARFRAVGYFDSFGEFRRGCPPIGADDGWTTALVLMEDR